jgi:copper(I)-binding protein
VRLQNRRVLGSTVLALGAALVLAGCGAGQLTQTASQEPAVNGAYAQVKELFIRDAALQYPPNKKAYAEGSTASLRLTIVNTGGTDDELVGVATDAAGGVDIQGSKLVVARNSLVVSPSEQTGATGGNSVSVTPSPTTSSPTTTASSPTTSSSSSSKSSTATSSSSATTSPSAPATTSSAPPVEVGKATIVLRDIKRPIWPGQTIKVTFTFRNAGPVTFDLPVEAPEHARPEAPAAAEGAEGGH